MTDKCKHLQEYDNGRYVVRCILTNDTCTAAVNPSGKMDSRGYMHNAAVYCPAFNLKGDLAKSLQKLHLDQQRTKLTDRLDLNDC